MTVKDLIVTELALFSWREGSRLIPGICPSAWIGIAHVLSNRLRAGWWDADYLKVLMEAPKHSCSIIHEMDFRTLPDHWSRDFRAHYEYCEQIYDNRLADDVTTSADPGDLVSGSMRPGMYYAVLGKVTNPWFREKILDHPDDHPRTAEISGGEGNLVFFG